MDWRMVIAFTEPPKRFGFKPAKSGKAWVRRIQGRDQALSLAAHLRASNIHGVIKKTEPPKPQPYTPRFNGTYTTRTSGFTAASRNPKNTRRRGRGRRGM
jgi:hypothetical protein